MCVLQEAHVRSYRIDWSLEADSAHKVVRESFVGTLNLTKAHSSEGSWRKARVSGASVWVGFSRVTDNEESPE